MPAAVLHVEPDDEAGEVPSVQEQGGHLQGGPPPHEQDWQEVDEREDGECAGACLDGQPRWEDGARRPGRRDVGRGGRVQWYERDVSSEVFELEFASPRGPSAVQLCLPRGLLSHKYGRRFGGRGRFPCPAGTSRRVASLSSHGDDCQADGPPLGAQPEGQGRCPNAECGLPFHYGDEPERLLGVVLEDARRLRANTASWPYLRGT